MSVDCNIALPGRVEVDDVANVIGVLAGLPVRLEPLGEDSIVSRVDGVKIETSDVHGMVQITLSGELADGEHTHFVYYHFEGTFGRSTYGGRRYQHEGVRSLSPRSTPFWVAIAKRLVDFFGGWVDYDDCDDCDLDYSLPERPNISPHDGKPWEQFHRNVAALKPITKQDMKAAAEWASYKVQS